MDITSLMSVASPAASHTVASSLAKAAATTTSGSGATDTGTSITSNDFLSLLVTEMKNQDPTQPTDPNAYIQQLVGVNSLQQLISINQELGSVTSSGVTPGAVAAPVSEI